MFDVPVLEATVSSAPTIIDSVSTINKIATPSTSEVSSALLNAAAVLTLPISAQSDVSGANDGQNVRPEVQTVFPNSTVQLLEPLSLGDVALSLEKVFELSLETQTPSESEKALLTKVLSSSIDKSAATQAINVVAVSDISGTAKDLAQIDAEDQQNISPSIESQTVVAKLKQSKPVVLRHGLSQCIDGPKATFTGITTFQVLRNGTLIGEVSSHAGAAHVVRSLQEILAPSQLDPNAITPVLGGEQPAIRLNNDVLAHVISRPDPLNTPPAKTSAVSDTNVSSEWAAIIWSDQLRQDLGGSPLDAGSVEVMMKGLQDSEQQLSGLASWYGPYFHGRLTANGEIFDQNVLTAAHKSLPFNTVLQVRNLTNNRSVVVRINDRGPYIGKRSLDLSKAAAQCLGSETTGVIPYEAVLLEQPAESENTN